MLSRRLPASRVVSAATVASTRSSPTSSTGSGGSLSSPTSSKHSGESLPRAVSNANNTAYRLYHAPQQYHVSDSMSSANQQQQQQQPVLLLTGDELHVSNEGVARSHYQLHTPQNASLTNSCTTWRIEEEYHLYDAFKKFVLRERNIFGSTTTSTTRIDIQEMDTRRVGTGGTTWEASLAMVLYFAQHPEQLQGQVIELGSGVGLGGILLHHVTHQKNHMVLTDCSEDILEQCQANIRARNYHPQYRSNIQTRKVDWYDSLCKEKTEQTLEETFDTVLACDCAYRTQDIPALAATLKMKLRRPSTLSEGTCSRNKMHLFGPYNRAAYLALIDFLKQDEHLCVEREWIEMHRTHLAASTASTTRTESPADDAKELEKASKSSTKLLHVTAVFQGQAVPTVGKKDEDPTKSRLSLSEID